MHHGCWIWWWMYHQCVHAPPSPHLHNNMSHGQTQEKETVSILTFYRLHMLFYLAFARRWDPSSRQGLVQCTLGHLREEPVEMLTCDSASPDSMVVSGEINTAAITWRDMPCWWLGRETAKDEKTAAWQPATAVLLTWTLPETATAISTSPPLISSWHQQLCTTVSNFTDQHCNTQSESCRVCT